MSAPVDRALDGAPCTSPDEDLVSLVSFDELDPDTAVEALGPPVGTVAAAPVRAADHLADKQAAITVS